MCKCLVGLCHLVYILFLLESGALLIGCIHDFACKLLLHGPLTPVAGVGDEPAQAEGLTALGTDLDRYLIGGTADTASLDLENGHNVIHGLLENLEGFAAGLIADDVECTVACLLGSAALAVEHNLIDELGYELAAVNRIIKNFPLGD